MIHRIAIFLAPILLFAGCHRDVTGTYLGHTNDMVSWLQLVRTKDDHVTGQFSASLLGPDGQVTKNSVTVTGVADSGVVSLHLQGLGLLSGTLDGPQLTLTGVGPVPFVLKRSDLKDYQKQTVLLDDRAKTVVTALALEQSRQQEQESRQQLAADIAETVGRMERFEAEAATHIARMNDGLGKYAAITSTMDGYVERERGLRRNSQADVARSQLSIQVTQASFATDQLHASQVGLESSLDNNIAPIAAKASQLARHCESFHNLHEIPVDSSQVLVQPCRHLEDAMGPFRQAYECTAGLLGKLEQNYLAEHSKQEQLVQTADKLE